MGTWILASIAAFVGIVMVLRPQNTAPEEETELISIRHTDYILCGLAMIFFAISIVSVFQLTNYYRYVADLQGQLSTIAVPKSFVYALVMNFWVEASLFLLSFIGVLYLSSLYFLKRHASKWKESLSLKTALSAFFKLRKLEMVVAIYLSISSLLSLTIFLRLFVLPIEPIKYANALSYFFFYYLISTCIGIYFIVKFLSDFSKIKNQKTKIKN